MTRAGRAREHREFQFAHASVLAMGFVDSCLCMFDRAGEQSLKQRVVLASLLRFSVAWLVAKAGLGRQELPIALKFRPGFIHLNVHCRRSQSDPALVFLRSVCARSRLVSGGIVFTFTGKSLRRYQPPPGLIG